jgi:hypothetical protein
VEIYLIGKIVAMMPDEFGSNFKRDFIFTLVCFVAIFIASKYFSWNRILNNEAEYNAQFCTYYISLQSLLANYPLISKDKANLDFIKSKLAKFEVDINNKLLPKSILAGYSINYFGVLKRYNLNSISNCRDPNVVIQITKESYVNIDNFYLDKKLFCINPMYDWTKQRGNLAYRILRYNLSGLYISIPTEYSVIMSAIADDWIAGPTAGLLFNNQTSTFDARFMTAMPLLTALYALPKYDFVDVGRYSSVGPWNYFRTNSFIDPISRKILDIGGIDVFTVKKSERQQRVIPDTKIMPTYINANYDAGLETFINERSYGIAYLANHVISQNEIDILNDEKLIKHYFSTHKGSNEFRTVTNALYQKLGALKEKHDIILELDNSDQMLRVSNNAGSVNIKGIVGKHALFITHCLRERCTFVFNIAKSPGWIAYVNGENAKIMRANLAFMAVDVPRGDANVWFIYEPISRLLGDFISLITLAIILFFSVRNISRKTYS